MKPECKIFIVKDGIETEVREFSQEECMRLDIFAIQRLLYAKGIEVMEIKPIFKNIL
ncbi:MAG: hypothetical protein PHY44_06365 [Lachnospiraceae bacterium]|nr:hypothetical protein [Lachnospiraceae bacterium]